MKKMEKFNGNSRWGFPLHCKAAEIELQEKIETCLKENGFNIPWWECLNHYPHVANIFLNFLEIYQGAKGLASEDIQHKSDKFMKQFIHPYIAYYDEVVDSVNDYIAKKKRA